MTEKSNSCAAWPLYRRARFKLVQNTRLQPLRIAISLKGRADVVTVLGGGPELLITLDPPGTIIGKEGYAQLCPEFGAVTIWDATEPLGEGGKMPVPLREYPTYEAFVGWVKSPA